MGKKGHILRFEGKKFIGRVNQNCRREMLNMIEKCLSPVDWQRITVGPFGPTVKMVRRQIFSCQLVHYVLFRQVSTRKLWETWYDLQGQLMRFSMKEFALVTGLCCHRIQDNELNPEKNAVKELFDVQNLTLGELESLFMRTQLDSPLKYKMAMLLILEGVILGVEKKVRISTGNVKLLADIDRFTKFPWGRVSYIETHQGLSSTVKNRLETVDTSRDSSARLGYKLKGLPMAFQVWLFEAVKPIASAFAHLVDKEAHPRGLRWSSDSQPDATAVESFLGKATSRFIPNVVLIEEEAEVKVLKECKFDGEVKDSYFDKTVEKFELSNKRSINGRRKGKSDSDSSPATKSSGLDARQMMCAMKELHERMINLENQVDAGFCAMNKTLGIMQQMIKERAFNKSSSTNDEQEEGENGVHGRDEDVGMDRMGGSDSDPLQDADDEGVTKGNNGNLGSMVVYREQKDDEDGVVEEEGLKNGEMMTKDEDDKKEGKLVARKTRSKKKKDDKDGAVDGDAVEGAIQDEGKSIRKEGKVLTRKTRSEKKIGDEEDEVQNDAKSKKGRTRGVETQKQAELEGEATNESIGLSTRTEGPSGELKDHPVRKRGLSREADNPKQCKVSTAKEFSNMNKLQRWLDSKESEEISSPSGQSLKREFFEPLLQPKGWLKSYHLDECIYYLGCRVRDKPVAILDTWFQRNLDKEMNRWLSDKPSYVAEKSKMRYLRGELPTSYGKDWKDVDRIYIPFNFKDKHWVALEIQLSKWCVTVYDPDVNLFKLSQVHRFIVELTYILSVMIAQYEPLAKIYEHRRGNPLNVTRVPTLERNKRGGDCGVFTIKYIEMLSLGRKNIVNVGDKFVDEYRKRIADSIFEMKWFD